MSIGGACIDQEADPGEFAGAMIAADRAMYEAKAAGRNTVRLA